MTQQEMILQFMQDTGSITPLDALREFGCMRLGARIWDLKRRGHEIRRVMESRENGQLCAVFSGGLNNANLRSGNLGNQQGTVS